MIITTAAYDYILTPVYHVVGWLFLLLLPAAIAFIIASTGGGAIVLLAEKASGAADWVALGSFLVVYVARLYSWARRLVKGTRFVEYRVLYRAGMFSLVQLGLFVPIVATAAFVLIRYLAEGLNYCFRWLAPVFSFFYSLAISEIVVILLFHYMTEYFVEEAQARTRALLSDSTSSDSPPHG
jgi:hypothetical protein